ncbi:hypothetical protein [Chitinophaga nivalis]|uniref:KTSC domain-containing protein n=1 Tax=Chitinophaga nivalis TaxID=2991709 RepID=A0ABT3INC1_9BACT|nr:hypothetical protein [Chitinophaga nivalis]MCW3464831.1 hypothetical protein [Chitinophaga nivalis]MCW3485478.1 hypothetical protein [Chitinophaga nivalis]
MQIYQNLDGASAVTSFLIGPDSITVEFNGDAAYLYDYDQPGSGAVEQMKTLALSGRGLNSYINKHVGKNYAAKLR